MIFTLQKFIHDSFFIQKIFIPIITYQTTMYFYRVLEETVLEMKVVPASPPWNLFRVDAEIPLRAWTAGEPQIRIRIQRPQTSQLRP